MDFEITVWVDGYLKLLHEPIENETLLMTYKNYVNLCHANGVTPEAYIEKAR